jgi:hypothetical protein
MTAYYSPAGNAASLCQVRAISLRQPFAWLARGWSDVRRSRGPSLLHGFSMMTQGIDWRISYSLFGLAMVALGWGSWHMLVQVLERRTHRKKV